MPKTVKMMASMVAENKRDQLLQNLGMGNWIAPPQKAALPAPAGSDESSNQLDNLLKLLVMMKDEK